MMNELLRIRSLIDSSKGASDMSNWKLLKSGTVEEETNSINIDLGGEYEELNILFLTCGTTSNNDINNVNASITYLSSNKNTAETIVNGFMMKNDVKRIFQIECKLVPYFNSTFKNFNASNFEKVAVGTYFGQGGSYDMQFNDKICSIRVSFHSLSAVFGIGSKYAIYGK